jgi:hypothetical protein
MIYLEIKQICAKKVKVVSPRQRRKVLRPVGKIKTPLRAAIMAHSIVPTKP